ncbi:hypothetical protein HOY80DRAFT_1038320 [Tuber brumale]|nr:hypothetical protein HOY80DRAFT_1038320 [Tuber brumale]
MSLNSHESVSSCYMPTTITTPSSSSDNGKTVPNDTNSSSNVSKTLPDFAPANPAPPVLTCPVPSCALAFKGEMSHGYLWRHLKRPGIYRRTGDEKAAWMKLHKIEHDQLVAAGITPAHRKRETNRVRAQKVSRSARFALRARDMGVTEESLVAEKVTIWEGMYAAKESGDSVGVRLAKARRLGSPGFFYYPVRPPPNTVGVQRFGNIVKYGGTTNAIFYNIAISLTPHSLYLRLD